MLRSIIPRRCVCFQSYYFPCISNACIMSGSKRCEHVSASNFKRFIRMLSEAAALLFFNILIIRWILILVGVKIFMIVNSMGYGPGPLHQFRWSSGEVHDFPTDLTIVYDWCFFLLNCLVIRYTSCVLFFWLYPIFLVSIWSTFFCVVFIFCTIQS